MSSSTTSLSELAHLYGSAGVLGSDYVLKATLSGKFVSCAHGSSMHVPIRFYLYQLVPNFASGYLNEVVVYERDLESGDRLEAVLWAGEFDQRYCLQVKGHALSDPSRACSFVGVLTQQYSLSPAPVKRRQWQLVEVPN